MSATWTSFSNTLDKGGSNALVSNSLHRNEILSYEEVELRRSSTGEGIALMPRCN